METTKVEEKITCCSKCLMKVYEGACCDSLCECHEEVTKVYPCTICHKDIEQGEVCVSCLEEGEKDPSALTMRDVFDEFQRD